MLGINGVANGFHGSFTVKADTMKAVLKDTTECSHHWGFKNIYILNFHGVFDMVMGGLAHFR